MGTLADSKIVVPDDFQKKHLESAGIYKRKPEDLHGKFTRFGHMDPSDTVSTTREYLFFTKPDLHIFKSGNPSILNPQIANMPIFIEALERTPLVLKALQWSADASFPFVNLLSNCVKSNLDLPGLTCGDVETSANLYGTNLTYRKSSYASDENYEFSLDFEETAYLDIYMFFKLFDEYERKKFAGSITPPNEAYIINKILHDQISIFKFIVAEDSGSILYYAKLFGCYSKTTPRDTFSELPATGGAHHTIQWKCQFVEDMEPSIINDFIKLTKPYLSRPTAVLYDNSIGAVNGEQVLMPFIEINNGSSAQVNKKKYKYKLNWKV